MKIIRKISQMQKLAKELHKKGKSIGFVPTMGALHEGHLSLIRRARRENDVVVVSIFVNPTQFAGCKLGARFSPKEDYRRYPRNLKKDAELCKKVGVDYIFAPSVKEIYPEGYVAYVDVGGPLAETLEGKSRPGHFRAVVTIVAKLFNIVQPDRAYFGEKDYQQLLVVKRMVADLNMPVKIVSCPLIRERDGLAMSSRNAYLNPQERRSALVLRVLHPTGVSAEAGRVGARKIINEIQKTIKKEKTVKLDYVVVRDGKTLEPVKRIKKGCVILLAAKVGTTRLIDNIKI